MAIANAQIIKRIDVETNANISHNIVDIRKPCAYLFASVRAAHILRPVRMYSIIRKALIVSATGYYGGPGILIPTY
jgi:hypothetical protein